MASPSGNWKVQASLFFHHAINKEKFAPIFCVTVIGNLGDFYKIIPC